MSERREREIGPATLHFREKGGKREGRGCVRNREKRSRAELENSVGTLRYIKGHQAQNVKDMGYMGHCT